MQLDRETGTKEAGFLDQCASRALSAALRFPVVAVTITHACHVSVLRASSASVSKGFVDVRIYNSPFVLVFAAVRVCLPLGGSLPVLCDV